MADEKKSIAADELKAVQELVTASRQAEATFFKMSVTLKETERAHEEAFNQMNQMAGELQGQMNDLKEVYGDIVVNLETGEYESAPSQEEAQMEVVEE
jgi:Cu2+-containing amine oxidase